MKKLSILLSFVIIANLSFGQSNKRLKEFSKDHTTYIEELNTFMLSGSASEDTKKMMKTITKLWKGSTFSTDKKEILVDVSNKMLKARKRASHFEALLSAVVSFTEYKDFGTQFNNWSSIVMHLIENEPTSRQLKFFKYTNDLFTENVIFKNRSLSWYPSKMAFSFSLNDSIPELNFRQPIDLFCVARGDTLRISQTQGVFYPMTGKWKGQGGLVDWKKAGFNLTEVYAELSDYNIALKTPNFKADSVKFYNYNIFGEKVTFGKLEDKLINRNKSDEKVSYPKFDSYDKNIILSDLIEDVDFQGGYSLYGNRFVSTGGNGQLASLIFYRNGSQFVRVSTERIAIVGKRVLGSNASVKILFANDSIIHPGLSLIYDQDERRLDLISDDEGVSSSPYVNTYHNLEMKFQKLEWKIDDDKITFGTIAGNNNQPAFFESSKYYTSTRFDNLMGIDAKHPLLTIKEFNKNYGVNNKFFVEDFKRISPYSDDQDIRFLMNLAKQGFLNYNSNLGTVYVKDNVERYIMARSEKIDHDVISLISAKPENNANAILDLSTMNLDIFGINKINVSEVRDVVALPSNQKIVVQEGLNFSMEGRLIAGSGGRFRIKSDDITFNYEDFRMYFKDASTEIWIPNNQEKRNEKGELILEPLHSEITISNGELLVDTSINKSGIWKEDHPQYPIIRSYDRSKVYYDQEDIFAGVYNRERFYFDIDPFEIDSLDSYDRSSLTFPGEMYTADIFPSFRQELSVQKDNALGFEISIPEGGHPLYVDKGKFLGANSLSLNKSGLRGSGTFEYLSSTTQSKDYIFFPDSMNTHATSFALAKTSGELGVPQASGNDVYEHWLPYEDVLNVKKKTEDLVLYSAKATLDGQFFLRPEGLTGGGKVALDESELVSNLYYFNLDEFNSDTADFVLHRSDDFDAIAFESVNLRTEINLVERTGTFQSNGTGSFVSFPENQYICYIDELKWFMDRSLIELGVSAGGSGSKFVSVHPEQDSLSFVSRKASYSLKDYIIQAEEVDEIQVADAAIYPADGAVTVETGSIMRTLYNATLMVNRDERYHELFDATIDIQGGKSYSGRASVNYKGRGIEEQIIQFDTLYVDSTFQSVAFGEISAEREFKFNPQFSYKGSVKMEGSQKEFLYDGSFQVQHECYLVNDGWVKFNDYVGVDEIKLPIGDNVLDEEGKNLYVGPIMSEDRIYPAFLSTLEQETDIVMMPINGYLSYNAARSMFIVEDKEDSLASRFTMSNEGCVMKGEGDFNLGLDLGRVDISTTGNFNFNAVNNTFKTTCMLSLDFYMSKKSMDFMGDDLYNDPMADELEMSENFYIPNFNRILGDEDLSFEYEMYGQFEKLPNELKKTLYFYEVNLEWDQENSSLMSKRMLGLGNINDFQINKLYKGRLELNNDFAGDLFNIYLETDIGEWYFFNYSNDVLLSRSSIEEYNIEIMEVKTQQKKLPAGKGETPYQYDLSSETDVDNFKKRFFR
jgi:hypothetical protein